MGVRKQSVSFTDPAFRYVRELVDRGDYPNVSAAVSGELARARAVREADAAMLADEVKRRVELPPDRWKAVGDPAEFTSDARAFLDDLELEARSSDE